MFSAFSFGKVIKTILPGSILAGALILLAEGLWQWRVVPGESLVVKLAGKDRLTAVTAALVPVSLTLGFLLNTWVWLFFNRWIRSQVEAQLRPTVFPEIRKKLSAELWQKISRQLADSTGSPKQFDYPARESLEYFYLPVVSLNHLNYLWESYFSWYEFQINTAFAIVLSTPLVVFLLWVKMHDLYPEVFLKGVLGLLVAVALVFWGLWYAARQNLTEYEKDLMLLIAGSLSAAEKKEAAGGEALEKD